MKLLILDDEVMSVEIMLRAIRWKDCGIDEVLTAYNAENGKKVMEHEDIDIILCDIEMPGDNGLDFMRWVRDEGYDAECIFLTCHAQFDYAQEAIRLRSRDYVLKPAPYEVIEQKVAKAAEDVRRKREDVQIMKMGQKVLSDTRQEIEKKYGTQKSAERTAEEIMVYVDEHLKDYDLSVQGIADAFSLNADYMGNLFKKQKGITLNKYIVQKRMETAALLIKKGNISIAAVAELVGYENYSYFSTSFKKAYGCTPAAYKTQD